MNIISLLSTLLSSHISETEAKRDEKHKRMYHTRVKKYKQNETNHRREEA